MAWPRSTFQPLEGARAAGREADVRAVRRAGPARTASRLKGQVVAEPHLGERPVAGRLDVDVLRRQPRIPGDEGGSDGAGGQLVGSNGLDPRQCDAVEEPGALREIGL